MPVNCEQLKTDDIHEIMRQVLYEFPVTEVEFYVPKWVEMLSREHRIKQDLLSNIRIIMDGMSDIRSAVSGPVQAESPYIEQISVTKVEMDTGRVQIQISFEQKYYYEVLSELTGTQISGEYALIRTIKGLTAMKQEFSQIKDAFADVKMKGYGVVRPSREDIKLDEPVIIKQGSKFGVKIRSEAPSIHMIRANIETEIAPIVGMSSRPRIWQIILKKKARARKECGGQIYLENPWRILSWTG